MSGEVLTFLGLDANESLKAQGISETWISWYGQQSVYQANMTECQEYLMAIDTDNTSNSGDDWINKTNIPKLTQIRDNLYANYQTGLFPNDEWLRWEGNNTDDDTKRKKEAITGYMANKTRHEDFRDTINRLLLDYIDYGNAYATAEYVRYTRKDDQGNEVVIFEGPMPRRISPLNIAYNPVAVRWADTPVIVQSNMTEGDLTKLAEDSLSQDFKKKIAKVLETRNRAQSGTMTADMQKEMEGITLQGLGNLHSYLTGNLVEILTFHGDYYDSKSKELKRNQKIMVVDRYHIVLEESNPTWTGKPIVHAAWRKRSGTLLGMSVLENLLGMQYRINSLENMKADILTLTAYPPFVIYGNVPKFKYGPGMQVHIPDIGEGRVDNLSPDVKAIALDSEIQQIMDWMEEFAGTPKETMGFRTPGEKTAFEVEQLMTSAGRMFQEKITNFEIMLLEPLLNLMLGEARNNLIGSDLARTSDDLVDATTFQTITPADIKASGKLRPIGARHFSEQAQLLKNLIGIMGSPLGAKLEPHMAGSDIMRVVENALNIEKWELFKKNASITETAEQQRMAQEAMARNDSVGGTELE